MSVPKEILEFPKDCSSERPLPADLWPDMKGLLKAKVTLTPSKADPLRMEIGGDVNVWDSSIEAFREFWKTAHNFPLVAVDTETTGVRPFHGSRIVGVSGAFWDGRTIQTIYSNLRHIGHGPHEGCKGYKETAPTISVADLQCLAPVYKDCIVGGANFKFDAKIGYVDGLPLPERVIDTQLVAHLFDDAAKSRKLATLAEEMGEKKIGDVVTQYLADHGLSLDSYGHAQVPYAIERPYGCMDAVLVLRRLQWERERWAEQEDPKLMTVFQLENACTPAYADMEIAGMRLDKAYAQRAVDILTKQIIELTEKVHVLAGKALRKDKHVFNILSADELWQVLESRGLKPLSLGAKDGKPCVDDANLAAYHDELCDLVREFRKKHKLLSTYFRPFLMDYVNDKGELKKAHVTEDGFIHMETRIDGTVTGRTSQYAPNLQNVVKDDDESTPFELEVRRCFVPRGLEFSDFFYDYDQAEMRGFASYAEDEFMLAELARGADIHESVARELFSDMPASKDVNPKLFSHCRKRAKAINFGEIFGKGVLKLAIELDVPVDECCRLLELACVGLREDPEFVTSNNLCSLNLAEVEALLEDHRMMYQMKQWVGIRSMSRDVECKINPGPLEERFITGGKNERLKMSAKGFKERYRARFTKIEEFTSNVKSALRRRGYLFNRCGRRYKLPLERAYVGVNRLVQGQVGDWKKIAAVRCYRLLQHYKAKSRMENDVHDELKFGIHHSELFLVPEIKECMETMRQISIPMTVDIKYSHVSWADKRPWKGVDEFMQSLKEHQDGLSRSASALEKGAPVGKKPRVRKSKVPAKKP